MKRAILFGLCFSLTGAGCAGLTRTLDKGTGALGEALLPVAEEGRLGRQLAAETNRREKVHPDPEVQAYVRKIGQRIVKASGDRRKGIQYTFTVIDNPQVVNAFAIVGGPIYVYSGLILAAKSEAELAAVLGHEVGHIVGRHSARALGTAFSLEALTQLALGKDPGTVAQLASGIAAQGYLSRHSRDAEREADRLGLGYLIRAGYDPNAMPRFFQELAKMGRSSNVVDQFFASHPDPGARAKDLQAEIRRRGSPKGKSEIVGDFAAMQRRLRGKASTGGGSPAPSSSQKAPSSSSSGGGKETPAKQPSSAPPPPRPAGR